MSENVVIDDNGKAYSIEGEDIICLTDDLLEDIYVVDIAIGDTHTVVLDNTGKIYAWGYNDCGQLGCDTYYTDIPICISDIDDNVIYNKKIVAIQAWRTYTITIDDEGEVNIFGKFREPPD